MPTKSFYITILGEEELKHTMIRKELQKKVDFAISYVCYG